jgi:hypothetical protein
MNTKTTMTILAISTPLAMVVAPLLVTSALAAIHDACKKNGKILGWRVSK